MEAVAAAKRAGAMGDGMTAQQGRVRRLCRGRCVFFLGVKALEYTTLLQELKTKSGRGRLAAGYSVDARPTGVRQPYVVAVVAWP